MFYSIPLKAKLFKSNIIKPVIMFVISNLKMNATLQLLAS